MPIVVGVILIGLLPSSLGSMQASFPSECDTSRRYREVAELFLRWAMSGEEHPVLGVFWDHERLVNAETVAVSCPFVPERDFVGLHDKFVVSHCVDWYHPRSKEGRCVRLGLNLREESEDGIEVSFGLTWNESAGMARIYRCDWPDGDLRIELVPNRVIIV